MHIHIYHVKVFFLKLLSAFKFMALKFKSRGFGFGFEGRGFGFEGSGFGFGGSGFGFDISKPREKIGSNFING